MRRWLLPLVVIGCGEVIPSSDPPDGGPPPPGFRVVSYQQLGLVPQPSVVQGRDAARSALLWGRSVWTFGTTVLNKAGADGKNWHINSFSTTNDLLGNDGLIGFSEKLDSAGVPARILEPTPDEAEYNANHAGEPCRIPPCGAYYDSRPAESVWDAARGRSLVFYHLAFLEPGSERRLGQSIAIWSSLETTPDRPAVSQGEHPTLMFGDSEPAFGAAAQVIGNDLYAFSCEPDPAKLNSPCLLARVSLDEVLSRPSWTYWDGAQFSSELADAAAVFTGNAVMTVVRSTLLDRWLAIYAEPLTNAIMARTAAELTGPWSDQVEIFKTPTPGPDRWTFDATLHDEYTENDGRTLYLSYSRPNSANGPFGSEVVWARVDIAAVAAP
jgi:Domain of unknown function (DUF4185)